MLTKCLFKKICCSTQLKCKPYTQWQILGEAIEAVTSGPLEDTAYSFILLSMFFRSHYEVGTNMAY